MYFLVTMVFFSILYLLSHNFLNFFFLFLNLFVLFFSCFYILLNFNFLALKSFPLTLFLCLIRFLILLKIPIIWYFTFFIYQITLGYGVLMFSHNQFPFYFCYFLLFLVMVFLCFPVTILFISYFSFL